MPKRECLGLWSIGTGTFHPEGKTNPPWLLFIVAQYIDRISTSLPEA